MQIIHWILIACGAVLFIWSAARWRTTAPSHSEYGARREVTILAVLLIVGVLGDAVRERYPDGSPGFSISTFALFPVAVGALVILMRMFAAFKRSQAPPGSKRDTRITGRDRRE